MKLLLAIAVCVTLTVASSDEELRQKLLRALENTLLQEKRQPSVVDSSSDTSGGNDTSYDDGTSEWSIDAKDFKDNLKSWSKVAKGFIGKVGQLKPKALQTLTRQKEWAEIEQEFSDLMTKGVEMHHKITQEATETLLRLIFAPKNFQDSGRCGKLKHMVETLDPSTDDLASVKTIEAITSDLDCMAGELKDEIGALEDTCLKEEDLTLNHAYRIINDVMRSMFRYEIDGSNFIKASIKLEQIWLKYKQQTNPAKKRGLGAILNELSKNRA